MKIYFPSKTKCTLRRYLIAETDPLELSGKGGTLAEKSRQSYETQYNRFIEWLETNEYTSIDENVVLNYFMEKAQQRKSSSLWSLYSMLKTTLAVNKGVDIGRFNEITAFLKKKSAGYKPEQTKIFTKEEIYSFLSKAPDSIFLMMKVSAFPRKFSNLKFRISKCNKREVSEYFKRNF